MTAITEKCGISLLGSDLRSGKNFTYQKTYKNCKEAHMCPLEIASLAHQIAALELKLARKCGRQTPLTSR